MNSFRLARGHPWMESSICAQGDAVFGSMPGTVDDNRNVSMLGRGSQFSFHPASRTAGLYLLQSAKEPAPTPRLRYTDRATSRSCRTG